MKALLAASAVALAAQAVWAVGSELYLFSAGSLAEENAPAFAADSFSRLLAGEPVVVAEQPLKARLDRTALRAARELTREGELERAHHYLGLVDRKNPAAAAESDALALAMTPARVAWIHTLLDEGKHEAALQAIARAEIELPGTPAVPHATLVAAKAEALNQALNSQLQAGHVHAAIDVAAGYPKDALLPLRNRAEAALASALGNAAGHCLTEGRLVDAYRLLQTGYEKLTLNNAVGALAVQDTRHNIDRKVWGRVVHAGLFTHPPLHERDPEGLAPSGSILVINDTGRPLPVSFIMADGLRQSKTIAVGDSNRFQMRPGHTLQLLELGDNRDALTVVAVGNGSYLQRVGPKGDFERPGEATIAPDAKPLPGAGAVSKRRV